MSSLSQFGAGVKSIQRGTISLAAASSGTATISSVVTGKTELRMLGVTTPGSNISDLIRIALTNATTITATSGASASSTVSWELTEFF